MSRKIDQELKVQETKPLIVNQQCVFYRFQCDLCDAGFVGTCADIYMNVWRDINTSSMHGKVPEDLLRRFVVLKK